MDVRSGLHSHTTQLVGLKKYWKRLFDYKQFQSGGQKSNKFQIPQSVAEVELQMEVYKLGEYAVFNTFFLLEEWAERQDDVDPSAARDAIPWKKGHSLRNEIAAISDSSKSEEEKENEILDLVSKTIEQYTEDYKGHQLFPMLREVFTGKRDNALKQYITLHGGTTLVSRQTTASLDQLSPVRALL